MMKTLLRVLALLVVFALIPIGGLSEANPRRAYEGTELNVLLKTGYETSAITEFQQEFEDATGITLNIEIYDEATMRNKIILDCNTRVCFLIHNALTKAEKDAKTKRIFAVSVE